MSEMMCKVEEHSVAAIRATSGRHNVTVAGVCLSTLQVHHGGVGTRREYRVLTVLFPAIFLLRVSVSLYALMCSHLLGCFQLCHPKFIS